MVIKLYSILLFSYPLFLSSTKSSKTKTKFPIERKNEFRSFFPFLVLFHENAAIGKFLKKRTKKQDAPLYTVLLKTVYIQRHILPLKNEII
ncbi:hypothetical protein CGC53_00140 [Capnocytophaga leadbetteri]|uniref:Uncharacterized protein n=1 Tax=Capnocytophaga leadbetteri TaxID=327575 RepID=A0A250F6X4_9FLAO|nr:hypothetical protein CGC53_00140 [Capnocytophaga leadbetteri]